MLRDVTRAKRYVSKCLQNYKKIVQTGSSDDMWGTPNRKLAYDENGILANTKQTVEYNSISLADLNKVTKNMKIRKSSVVDNIQMVLWKYGSRCILRSTSTTFNSIGLQGKYRKIGKLYQFTEEGKRLFI